MSSSSSSPPSSSSASSSHRRPRGGGREGGKDADLPPALFEPLKEALIKEADRKGLDFGPVRAVDLAKLTGDLQQFMEVTGREKGREGGERVVDENVDDYSPTLPPSLPPSLRMSLVLRPSSKEKSG